MMCGAVAVAGVSIACGNGPTTPDAAAPQVSSSSSAAPAPSSSSSSSAPSSSSSSSSPSSSSLELQPLQLVQLFERRGRRVEQQLLGRRRRRLEQLEQLIVERMIAA